MKKSILNHVSCSARRENVEQFLWFIEIEKTAVFLLSNSKLNLIFWKLMMKTTKFSSLVHHCLSDFIYKSQGGTEYMPRLNGFVKSAMQNKIEWTYVKIVLELASRWRDKY